MDRLSYLAPPTSFLRISHISEVPANPRYVADQRHATLRQLGSPSIDCKTPRFGTSQRVASYSASEMTDEWPLRAPEEAAEFRPGRRFYLAFSGLAALSLVVALDGTSLSVALPVIAQDIGGKAIDAFWAGTSFLLASTVSLPIYAALSHIFGRKQITLIAVCKPLGRSRIWTDTLFRQLSSSSAPWSQGSHTM